MESSLGKNPENYENIRKETNIYEQNPVTIDNFNKVKEKEVKEHVEKWRQKRREVAQQNKLLKKRKKKGKKETRGDKNKRKRHVEMLEWTEFWVQGT